MEFAQLDLPGCFLIAPRDSTDARGRFVKPFARSQFAHHGLMTNFVEQFYSVSHPGVLRGMHFQLPPAHHAKLVYCVAGEVRDVLLDLRRNSSTYGRHVAITLSAATAQALYIPPGIAHGFSVTGSASATMVYNVTSEHSPKHDAGVLWSSFGCDWGIDHPTVSTRDAGFPSLADFSSPF